METILYMIENGGAKEDDDDYQSPLDLLFEALEEEQPQSHCPCAIPRSSNKPAGKPAQPFSASAAVRLASFTLPKFERITASRSMHGLLANWANANNIAYAKDYGYPARHSLSDLPCLAVEAPNVVSSSCHPRGCHDSAGIISTTHHHTRMYSIQISYTSKENGYCGLVCMFYLYG